MQAQSGNSRPATLPPSGKALAALQDFNIAHLACACPPFARKAMSMHNDTNLPPDNDNQIPNPNILHEALTYASRGWPVLPLYTVRNGQCSCGNTTCSSPGKH